jgi:hypothetical protein
MINATIDPTIFNQYGVTEPSVIITWNMLYEFTLLVFMAGVITAIVTDEIIKRYQRRAHE